VRSTVGKGSVFELILPATVAAPGIPRPSLDRHPLPSTRPM